MGTLKSQVLAFCCIGLLLVGNGLAASDDDAEFDDIGEAASVAASVSTYLLINVVYFYCEF